MSPASSYFLSRPTPNNTYSSAYSSSSFLRPNKIILTQLALELNEVESTANRFMLYDWNSDLARERSQIQVREKILLSRREEILGLRAVLEEAVCG